MAAQISAPADVAWVGDWGDSDGLLLVTLDVV